MKIKTPPPSPLAEEYLAKKRLNTQSKKTVNLRSQIVQPDTVTLSSDLPDNITPTAKSQPSKPVTLEEQQFLNSTLSVQA